MDQKQKIRVIGLIFTILSSVFLGWALFETHRRYTANENAIQAQQEQIHTELLRIDARDGTPQKALYFISPELANTTDQSVPFAIICHGMSDDFNYKWSLAYTLTQQGYAVLIPEFRGHGSNPAPSTLGYKEGYDVLDWLDHMEQNFAALNTSASVIFGESMGGLYATLAYIFESQADGRFQALVSVAGVLNISAEIEFLMENPHVVGDLDFADHIEEKNPVLFVNSTFPENVLIAHGTADTVVTYQCATDFIAAIDPYGNRTDVRFYSLEGVDHSVDSDFTTKHTVAWFNHHLFGDAYEPENVEPLRSPLRLPYREVPLLRGLMMLVILVPALLALINPRFFEEWWLKRTSEWREEFSAPYSLDTREKAAHIGVYFFMVFLIGNIAMIIPGYIVTNFMLLLIGNLFFLVVYIQAINPFKNEKPFVLMEMKESINWKVALLLGIPIILAAILTNLISSSPAVENMSYIPGLRVTWWIPYMAIWIAGQLITNIYIVRMIRNEWEISLKSSVIEALLSGAMIALSLFLFLYYGLDSQFSIPAWNIGGSLVLILCLGFFVAFFVFTLVVNFFDFLTDSIVPGAILCSFLIPYFVAASELIFFY